MQENKEDAPELTEAQRKELDRRLDELESGRMRTIPWEDVLRELERDE